jgi:DNA polymerase elongation subunit (family B)
MFISAYNDRHKGKVLVWERLANGSRVKKEYDQPFYFYQEDRLGDFETITGKRVKRVDCTDEQSFEQAVMCVPAHKRFESDFDPLERVLMDNYSKAKPPTLHIGFIDIEVDYKSELGFAGPKNPYAPINALTLFYSETEKYVTLAVPPKSWDWNTQLPENLSHVILCRNETELLELFLDLLHEIDVLSGWNSEFYDMPYIGKRIEMVFGKHALRRLGFEGGPAPRWSEMERFKGGKVKDPIIVLNSRVHLDYMRLFKKFNLTSRQSYSLNSIGMDELNEPKIHYAGTLEELYNNDFILFLTYNTHDVTIVKRLDDKFKYIELANQMVHMATVNFEAVFGSVQLIDSAIINYAHNELGKIVFDRQVREEGPPVEGAIVVTPKPGFYEWIGSCDINSLYPSTIRSLNLSPEMIIGQLLNHEDGWRSFYYARIFPDNLEYQNAMVPILFEGESEAVELTAGELVDICNTQKWAVSGYGTILDQSKGEGLLASVLSSWFKGRKQLQDEKKKYGKLADQLIKEGKAKDDPEVVEAYRLYDYYDMLQGVRKVLLNSTYGALLNAFMRFGDPRLGASTTYTGRQITTNMINTASQTLCGLDDYPKLKKQVHKITKRKRNGTIEHKIENEYTIDTVPGMGPLYGDTDSCYFTMSGLVNNADDAILMADYVAEAINNSFPPFMRAAFNCGPGFDELIRAARELVCRTGILQAKKKYMMAMVDKEGKRVKEGDDELKTMGSDIKLSSTPEVIRTMLKEVVMMILNKRDKKEIDEVIINFRSSLKLEGDQTIDPLDLSTIVSVNELEEYQVKWENLEKVGRGKVSIPANARATINYNFILEKLGIQDEPEIISGSKIKILWLKENPYGFTNIAFPSETETLPEWFKKHFDVDMAAMEQKLVDQKLQNIFDALDWSVPTFQSLKIASLLDIDDVGAPKKSSGSKKQQLTPEQEAQRMEAAKTLLDFD